MVVVVTFHCDVHFLFHLDAMYMCSSYTIINDGTRHMKYGKPAAKCDSGMAVKWYRLTGATGVRMPRACLSTQHCSTDAPGWLSEPHPTIAQGTLSRTVCFNWNSNCCNWNTVIRVRNCGRFYVYEFQPAPSCPLRYCGTN